MTPTLELRHFTHADLPDSRQTLIGVHADVHAARMTDDAFRQKFPWFVDHWGGNPGFSCVIAYDGGEAVGFAYGAPSAPGREWWRGQLEPVPEKGRTFHFSELMVRERWRKTGSAERLHRALMEARDEDLAALLVDTTHPRVQTLYEAWGYRKIGEDQPFPDSPVYAVMVADLPLQQPQTIEGPAPPK
ncbi:acetyltransferase [Streptomyces sp. NRRL F-5755]|uniref:GNAT family N-acetyltransferase n=1 Tax=Streptomyces sp. NRRL F-5755 TaxID=1519475 RepID=UPI0006AE3D8B|nr:GNAT family N-acetyltransferase [Streptomyces sp. NRRL F-5755]KOU00159.1 acetyltransferase [Streptomyces sp. NRRL F-5755]